MATTFKQRVLFALGALSIAVVGFSICAQAADLDRPESAPLGQAAPNSARVPEMVDRERGGTPPGKQPGDPQPLAKERFKYEGSHGALTADGKTLATWGREFIVLWSTATGKEIGKIKHQGGSFYVRASAFSPDGKFLAAAMLDRDAEIVIWEVATQKQQIALTQRIEEFMSVAWSPDGKILAAGDDSGTLRLYDVQASKLMATLDMKNSGDITALAFAPGGKMLAAAGSGGDPSKVIIWDLASRTVAAELTETTVGVSSLGYTADGKTLISSLRDRVSFWDMEARKLRSTIVSQQKNVNCAAITPDGKLLATGSSDKTVVLWDVATGKPLATLQGHAGSLASLSFSADGRLLLAVRTALNGVRLWELTP